ncbi:hypothetical protein [Planktothrix agardhii]|uniref:hypothetical protein n=1 Tax=Planktothrix agardhii TaxID=1160 RepID=UPI0011869AEA|nr:hypothetical protein [Planktothrix agardhii]
MLLESQNKDKLITDKTPESQGLEASQTDKLSLKHPDFHQKLKGFMGDPKKEKAKHQSSSVNPNP